jgi:serine/threonine protein phosphatase PrpC
LNEKRNSKRSRQDGHPLAAEGTDPGQERDNNEDRTLLDSALGIYAVVDGVGGESGGEVAAQMAVDVLRARLSRRTTDTARLIREAIALANKQIYESAQDEPGLEGMSCVLTVAVLDEKTDDGQVTIGHVGDSRLYLMRRGTIRKVTRDHSPVGMREDAGELSELEAMRHPRRNEIFRDVGSAPHEPDEEGFIEIHQLPFDAESALLICSDGLSDMVTSGEILETVENRPGNPAAAVRDLIAAANAAGGKDNISIVLVEGTRFAEAVGSHPATGDTTVATVPKASMGSTSSSTSTPLRRAASVKPGLGERLWGLLTSWPAFLLYGLALGALALYFFRAPLRPWLDKAGLSGIFSPAPERGHVLRVDARGASPQTLRTIAEALAQAQPGDTVDVGPGTYAGPLQLKDGVSLVSRTPRGAVIRLPRGVAEPAVAADGVHGVRFAGFLILGGRAGSAEAPLAMGLRLANSAVDVENVEISGATTAGLEIAGSDRSSVRDSYIHDNPGAGVIVRDQAAPSLRNNLIHRNGTDKTVPRPGVEIRDAARPQLIDNKLEGNGAAAVWVPAADRVEEIFGFNSFGALPRDKAVQVSPRSTIPGTAVTPSTPVPPAKPPSPRPRRSR